MTIQTTAYPTTKPALTLDFANSRRLDPRISFSRSSSGSYIDREGVMQYAGNDIARFDHNGATLESLGLLVEEARTNILKESALRTGDWVPTNVNRTPNALLAPDGTFTAVKIESTTGTWQTFLSQSSVTGITASAHTFSVFAKAGEASWLCLAGIQYGEAIAYFNLSSGTLGTRAAGSAHSITAVGNGWYRCSVSCASTSSTQWGFFAGSGDNTLTPAPVGQGIYVWGAQLEAGAFPTSYIQTPSTFTGRTSTATYYDANGVLQTANSGVARSAAYFPDSNGVMRPAGLLLEAAGTNLAINSEDFTQWGNEYGMVVTANNTTAPNGTSTADRLTQSNGLGAWQVLKMPYTVATSDKATVSVFAKAGNSNQLLLGNGWYGAVAYFDLSAGTVTSVITGHSAGIQKLSNGWYRCWFTNTSEEGRSPAWVGMKPGVGDNSSYIYIWGAQAEISPYPTSYIPTTTATVTRAADTSTSATVTRSADVAQITGTNFSSWYNQSAGTLVASLRAINTTQGGVYGSLTVGGADTDQGFYLAASTTQLRGINYLDSGSSSNDIVNNTPLAGLNKLAIAGSVTDNTTGAYFNGLTGSVNANRAQGYINVAGMKIGEAFGQRLTGTISRLTYWPVRLSDSTLAVITR